jgi:hypothetical protein
MFGFIHKLSSAKVPALFAGILALASVESVRAIPTLTLTSDADSQTTQDLDGDGVIEFSGTVGNFDLNFTIGLTKPTLGTAANPWMDVISLNANTGDTGGTLTLRFEEDNFTGTPLWMQAAIGGTTDGSVIYNTYVNDKLFSTSGTLVGPAFDDVQAGYLTATAPYKLTIEAILTHSSGMQISSFDAEFKAVTPPVAVPDGGTTTLLLGLGFLSSLAVGRRCSR